MLVLKLELHSHRTKEVTELGRTIIANIGGTSEKADYICKVGRKSDNFSNISVWQNPVREGTVKSYPRLSYNVWRLVIRALLSAFPEEKTK